MSGGKVTIVDYGVGNLYSVQRALEVSGASEVCISSKPDEIRTADRIILPGVGSFADGMKGLRQRGLESALIEFAHSGRPFLGICLGMQLLATTSEEFGEHAGLDIIPGKVKAMPTENTDGIKMKSPHIGWSPLNRTAIKNWHSSVLNSVGADDFIYLVHSFYFEPSSNKNILATFRYGGVNITAAVIRNNITGLQFHPERSGKVGLSILTGFLQQTPL